MIQITFTDANVKALKELQQNHPHSHVRSKALALILLSYKIEFNKVIEIIGVCANTLRTYCKEYLAFGVDKIKEINFRKPESQLKQFEDKIKEYVKKSPPISIAQACSDIKALTDIDLKRTQVRTYLKSLGIKYRKVGGIPAKADTEIQKQFLENELQPRLNEAKDGKRTVLFCDSAHFVQGAFLGYLWNFVRIFIKTPSGRKRYNVLGTLNAETKELITISNDSYITSEQVCELLHILVQKYTGPITIVMDNARYQRCKLVIDLAEKLGIELLFLPAYSPNLNLIERLWRFTKKHCLNSKYYDTFSSFTNAISGFLLNVQNKYKDELASLLSLKFQFFSDKQINNILH